MHDTLVQIGHGVSTSLPKLYMLSAVPVLPAANQQLQLSVLAFPYCGAVARLCIAGNTEESQCCRNAEFMELKCKLTPDQSALYDAAVSVWQVCTLSALPLSSMVNGEDQSLFCLGSPFLRETSKHPQI